MWETAIFKWLKTKSGKPTVVSCIFWNLKNKSDQFLPTFVLECQFGQTCKILQTCLRELVIMKRSLSEDGEVMAKDGDREPAKKHAAAGETVTDAPTTNANQTSQYSTLQRAESESAEGAACAGAAVAASTLEDSPSPSSSSQDPDQGPKEGKKKKNRCLSCKKKVGLTGKAIIEQTGICVRYSCAFVFFQASPAAAEASSAQYTDTVISTNATSTTRSSGRRRSARAIPSSSPRRCRRFRIDKKAKKNEQHPLPPPPPQTSKAYHVV